MKPSARLLLKIRDIWKKYWKYIVSVIVVWITVIMINTYLKNRPKQINMVNTYTPDTPVIEDGGSVPKKDKEEVNNTIDTYFNYCNNKEYQKAYNMLTKDCQAYLYSGSISSFKEYVDETFQGKKIYNIQNFSNVGETYIYNLRILDDIMASGTTGGYNTYQEKIALIREDGKIKIANQGYIGRKIFNNIVGEDNYLKIKVLSKNMSYTREEYSVEITNKTSGYVLLGNGMTANEITLNLKDQSRASLDLINNNIILAPRETKAFYLLFDKYFDDGKIPTELNFNLIRTFDSNINSETAIVGDTNISSKVYSLNIPLS